MVEVVRQRGSVGELHALDPFGGGRPEPAVWWCDPTDVALVLGSRQTLELVDVDACRAAGIGVTTRRTGGGAVLVDPARMVWVDVVLPHGMAPDDVRGSMIWVGARVGAALVECGHPGGGLDVHATGMLCGPGSSVVCFAGIGPGEVLDAGRKLVGLSQRRTRHGIRVQAMVHTRPLQHRLRELLVVDVPPLDPIAAAAALDAGSFAAALAARL